MVTGDKIKHCPRCNAVFDCKSAEIRLCQCQSIHLSAQQKAYVNAQYDDCLCVACLRALRREYDGQQ